MYIFERGWLLDIRSIGCKYCMKTVFQIDAKGQKAFLNNKLLSTDTKCFGRLQENIPLTMVKGSIKQEHHPTSQS